MTKLSEEIDSSVTSGIAAFFEPLDDSVIGLPEINAMSTYTISSNCSYSSRQVQWFWSSSKGNYANDYHLYNINVSGGQTVTITIKCTMNSPTEATAYMCVSYIKNGKQVDELLYVGQSLTLDFSASTQLMVQTYIAGTGTYAYAAYGARQQYSIEAKYTMASPDLMFVTPTGWSGALVASTTTGTNSNSSSFTEDDNIYLDFAFGNAGGDISKTYYVSILVDGNEVDRLSVTGGTESGGAYVPEDYNLGKLSAGQHTITVKLDSTGVVSESNESNNTVSKTITVTQSARSYDLKLFDADFFILSTTGDDLVEATSFTTDDTVYLTFVGADANGQTVPNFEIAVYVDGKQVEKGGLNNLQLDSGSYIYPLVSYDLGQLTAGSHTVKVVVDPDNKVAETNESNNTYTRTITVKSVASYDLALMELSDGYDDYLFLSPSDDAIADAISFTTDDTIYLTFIGGDMAGQSVDNFQVAIYIDGKQIEKGGVPCMDMGDGQYVYPLLGYELGQLTAGSHTVKVVVDPDNKVAETNESNNTYTRTITVSSPSKPDLAEYAPSGWSGPIVTSTVTGTNTNATKITTEDNVYVDVAFGNDYSAINCEFYVALFLDDEIVGAWTVDSMNADSYTAIRDFDLGKLSAGEHTLIVLLDPTEAISESDEDNNIFYKTFTVTQKSVSADSYESGTGDNSRFKATKLTVGQTQSHTIHSKTDEDWMVFEVAEDGFYSVVTSGGDTVLQLYSFENQAFCYNDDRGNGDTGSFDTVQLYAGTKYYARVTGKDGALISYDISVTKGAVEDPFEKNNDDTMSGASLLTAGQTQSHTIDSATDVDWIKFMVEEKGSYYFSIGTSERYDGQISIEIYGSSGNKLDLSGHHELLHKLSGENPYIAAEYGPGMYYVKVTSAHGNAAGLYCANLTRVSTFDIMPADDYEDDAHLDTMSEIKVGQTQTHSLNVWSSGGEAQLDVDLIKFTPTETGTYAIQVSNSDAPTHMTVYVTDDYGLLVPVAGDNRINPFVENYFQAGQTYVIQMENDYLCLNVERYDITVTKTSSYTSEKDNYEGDDTQSAAKVIALGESQAHSIHTVGDQDWVKFTPSSSGYYTFYTGARNGNAGDPDMVLGLYDANGKLLANDDNSFACWNAMVAYELKAGQTYYLQAQAARANTVVPYYTITVAKGVIEDSFDIYMDERSVTDDTMDTAMRVDQNTPTAHTLHSTSDVDWMWFEITEDGDYTIQTTGNGDTYIRLYDLDGNLLAVDDDGGVGKNAAVTMHLTVDPAYGTGRYIAEVSSYHGEVIPLYYAMVTKADAGGAGDAYEDDDSRAKAKGIVAGESQSRSIHDAGDEDWVLFRPIQSGAYQIQTNGDGDMKLDLYDAQGNLLATDDDSGTGLNARIGQTLQANTDYYIKVYAYKKDVTVDSYALNVTLLQTSELGDAYESDDDPAKAKAIKLGETQTHSIHTAGDVDWVTFTPTQGGEYTLQTIGSGLNCDTQLFIYKSLADAQADRYLKWDDDSGTDRNAKITIRLDKDATYYVKAQAWEDYTIPSYGLKVTLNNGDEYESDDLSGDCKPIAVGREYTHSIHAKSDTDWVRFYTHESGTYTIQTTGDADMSFIVYKRTPGGPLVPYENGAEIATGGAGNNALYSVYMETDNWYYVRITTTGRQSTASSYGIRVDMDNTSTGTGDAYETAGGKQNDNAASRATWLTANSSQVHSIHVKGDEDWFAFKTAVAGRYTMNLSSLALNVTMYVKNADGSLTYIGRNGAMGTDNSSVVDVAANETYYFKVAGVDATTLVESYTIALSLPMDGYESDDLSGNATRIALGQRQSHSLHTSEDVDWVAFDVTQAGDYIVKNDNGGAVNMILYKKGASGNTEIGASTSTATYQKLTTGTYYVRMASANRNANTGYSVTVERDVTVQADSYESDNTRSAAKAISVGAEQKHTLHTTTDVDYVKFYATAGSTYTVSTTGADLSVQIQNSSGTVKASDSGNGASAYYEVTSSGYYYAQIKSANGETVDSYTVSLAQTTANTEENYVILFNGGGDEAHNTTGYYLALRDLYETLVTDYGISPDHIYILSADGLDDGLDQTVEYWRVVGSDGYWDGSVENSDYRFATDRGTKVLSATKSNLVAVVNELSGKVDENDHFFFWATDHGSDLYSGNSKNLGNEYICGWKGEENWISAKEINGIFSSLESGYQSFMFATCYSGGMLAALDMTKTSTRTRWGAACAAHSEFGWGATGTSSGSWDGNLGGYRASVAYGWGAEVAHAFAAGANTTSAMGSYMLENADYICKNSYTDNDVCTQHAHRNFQDPDHWSNSEKVSHPWAKGSNFQIFAQA